MTQRERMVGRAPRFPLVAGAVAVIVLALGAGAAPAPAPVPTVAPLSEAQFSAISQLSAGYKYQGNQVESPFNRQRLTQLTRSPDARAAGYAQAMVDLLDTVANAKNKANQAALAGSLQNLSLLELLADAYVNDAVDANLVGAAARRARAAEQANAEAGEWRVACLQKDADLYDRITGDLTDDGRGPDLDRLRFNPGEAKVTDLSAGPRGAQVTVELPNVSSRPLRHCVVYVRLTAGSRAKTAVDWARGQAGETGRVAWHGLTFKTTGKFDLGLSLDTVRALRPDEWSTARQAIYALPEWRAGSGLTVPLGSELAVVLAQSASASVWSDDGHLVQVPINVDKARADIERAARSDYVKNHLPKPTIPAPQQQTTGQQQNAGGGTIDPFQHQVLRRSHY